MPVRGSIVAGVGGIAFAVLTFVAQFVGKPPGGNYKASDVADYLAKGHRPSVYVSEYLVLLGVLGLICLLAHLRDRVRLEGEAFRLESIFWGSGLAAAACIAAGWSILVAPSLANAFGGSNVSFDPRVTYDIVLAGAIVMIGAGGFLLAVAMIALALGARATLPAWLRWLTLIAGVIALASLAYLPFFVTFIWALVIGVWLVATARVRPGVAAPSKPMT